MLRRMIFCLVNNSRTSDKLVMDKKIVTTFRNSLARKKDLLTEWLADGGWIKKVAFGEDENSADLAECRDTVSCRITLLDDTMHRIDTENFGKCEVCGGEVEVELLELDFTASVCLDCYSEQQKRELEHDLELAAKVHQHLFPRHIPAMDGIQISVSAEPARIVGGDYFDFYRYRETLQGLALADVMGKGVPASMLMANLQASLRILGPEHDELHTLAARLNELFRYNLKLIRFISLFLAGIDMPNRIFYYCNAGHNPPLWWNEASGTIKWLKPTGPAIGVIPEPRYESGSIEYGTGDLLLLYTDGLIEARNGSGTEFGADRLAGYTRENAHLSSEHFLNGLRKEVVNFAGKLQDDTTVMVLKII